MSVLKLIVNIKMSDKLKKIKEDFSDRYFTSSEGHPLAKVRFLRTAWGIVHAAFQM